MTIAERLRAVRVKAGYETAKDASSAFGWQADTYRSHENGNRGVPRKWLITYSKAFRCSLAWLTTGSEDRPASSERQEVPIIEWASLPKGRAMMNVTELVRTSTTKARQTISFGRSVGGEPVALPVKDDSMIDPANSRTSLHVGDHVLIDMSGTVKPGSMALIYSPDDQDHAFRRAEFVDRKKIRFVASNPAFPPTILAADSQHILGVVVGLARDFT